jgi:hypothetical protein
MAARNPRKERASRSADQVQRLESLIVQMSNPAVTSPSVCAWLQDWGAPG